MSRHRVRFFEFGPFRIDAVKRLLLREDKPVPLVPKAFDTLLTLVENSGQVLTKEELISKVWPDSFVEEINLTVYISALRKVLDDSPSEHKYIVTVPRRGYSFVANVAEACDDATTPRTMAVLPFNMMDSDGKQNFELGLADALITKLSKLKQISVRPTSAVANYTGRTYDPIAAGRKLGVDAVIQGNIQRDGEHIRVTVQMISIKSGCPLWAESFDESNSSIFNIQDSISEQITRALAATISGRVMVTGQKAP